MDEEIEKLTKRNLESVQEIDPIAEFDKKYKPRKRLSPEKQDSHILIALKKSEIEYERSLLELQLELVKLQKYVQENGKRVLIIFE